MFNNIFKIISFTTLLNAINAFAADDVPSPISLAREMKIHAQNSVEFFDRAKANLREMEQRALKETDAIPPNTQMGRSPIFANDQLHRALLAVFSWRSRIEIKLGAAKAMRRLDQAQKKSREIIEQFAALEEAEKHKVSSVPVEGTLTDTPFNDASTLYPDIAKPALSDVIHKKFYYLVQIMSDPHIGKHFSDDRRLEVEIFGETTIAPLIISLLQIDADPNSLGSKPIPQEMTESLIKSVVILGGYFGFEISEKVPVKHSVLIDKITTKVEGIISR